MDLFLTAYDPSDLPGGSIDPLGFERGYLFLADKILPGMTNVASCPRYFGMLCAASLLSGVGGEEAHRNQRTKRVESILRLERLWALANVLAKAKDGNLSGLRGVTYAQRQAERLNENGHTKTSCDYKLLVRQAPYGAVGIYGAVSEYCKLLYRKTYELTPGLGAVLAECFIEETGLPKQIKKAVVEAGEVSVSVLAEWGERAYLWGKSGTGERACIADMIDGVDIRSRFALLATKNQPLENETEIQRLGRMTVAIKGSDDNHDIWESLQAIMGYESCYRLAQLAFERLLFLCRKRSGPGGSFKISDLTEDKVFLNILAQLPVAVGSFCQTLEKAETAHFRQETEERLADVRQFLVDAATAGTSSSNLCEIILNRHRDVQHGKFDHGRRKMPWIQMNDGKVSLTMTRVGGLDREATEPEDITPHFYRLEAADNWMRAAGRYEDR